MDRVLAGLAGRERTTTLAPMPAVCRCNSGWLVKWSKASPKVIRTWRPDVLHLHVFWMWPIIAQGATADGDPCSRAVRASIPGVVDTVHSLDRSEYEVGRGRPECLSQERTCSRAVPQVVTVDFRSFRG